MASRIGKDNTRDGAIGWAVVGTNGFRHARFDRPEMVSMGLLPVAIYRSRAKARESLARQRSRLGSAWCLVMKPRVAKVLLTAEDPKPRNR